MMEQTEDWLVEHADSFLKNKKRHIKNDWFLSIHRDHIISRLRKRLQLVKFASLQLPSKA